jgi:hypothetical protein
VAHFRGYHNVFSCASQIGRIIIEKLIAAKPLPSLVLRTGERKRPVKKDAWA